MENRQSHTLLSAMEAVAHGAFEIPVLCTAIAAKGRQAVAQDIGSPFAPRWIIERAKHYVPGAINVLNAFAVAVYQPAA